MSKIKIDYADYQALIEMAKYSPSTTELNKIVKKYSTYQLINKIKVGLFNEVKKYSQGSVENKEAYRKYEILSGYAEDIKKYMDNDNEEMFRKDLMKTIEEFNIDIEKLGIDIESLGLEDLIKH